jgi:hypothetical protein
MNAPRFVVLFDHTVRGDLAVGFEARVSTGPMVSGSSVALTKVDTQEGEPRDLKGARGVPLFGFGG